jgi:c-di-GMP-binding flagellar brake protein YcgR
MGLLERLFGFNRDQRRPLRPRANARVPIGDHAELRRPTETDGRVVTLADLSTAGAKVVTTHQMAVRDDVKLVIQRNLRQSVEIDCKIIYRRFRTGRLHIDYGLQFIAIHPGDVEALQAFISERDEARKKVAVPYQRRPPRA